MNDKLRAAIFLDALTKLQLAHGFTLDLDPEEEIVVAIDEVSGDSYDINEEVLGE